MESKYLFSGAEQLAAYRLIMSEEEAQEMVEHVDEINATLGQPGGAIGISYSEATLDLLAMVSPELAAKVAGYRRFRAGLE
jgi:hypothetical protein